MEDNGYPHDSRADKNPYPHNCRADKDSYPQDSNNQCIILRLQLSFGGARWLSGRVSDSGARGRGFETYRRCVVSLSKTLYSPKVLVNYPGSSGSVPI